MIRGQLVTLRPASQKDRRAVYEWMVHPEISKWMMGPPLFPEVPVPTWDEFCADYVTLFFDGSRPEVGRSFIIEAAGESIGHVSYSEVDPARGKAELDIWMRSAADCGKGYGKDALVGLTQHLHETMVMTEFIMRPSARNPRAIRAYAKAGFIPLPLSPEQQVALYGATEHYDSMVLRKRM